MLGVKAHMHTGEAYRVMLIRLPQRRIVVPRAKVDQAELSTVFTARDPIEWLLGLSTQRDLSRVETIVVRLCRDQSALAIDMKATSTNKNQT